MPTDTAQQSSSHAGWIESELQLPRSSFTAFRFLYGNAQEISQVSEVTLLGSIPKLWYKEQNSSFIKTWTKASYSTFHKTIKGVGTILNTTYRAGNADIYKDPVIQRFLSLTRQSTDEYETELSSDREDDYLVTPANIDGDQLSQNEIKHEKGKVLTAAQALKDNLNGSKSSKSLVIKDAHPQGQKQKSLMQLSTDTPPITNLETEISTRLPSASTITNNQLISLPDSSVQTFYSAAESIVPSEREASPNASAPEILSPNNSSNSTGTIKPTTPPTHPTVDRNLTIPSTRSYSNLSLSSQNSVISLTGQQKVRFNSASSPSRVTKQSPQFLRPEPDENPIILPLDPRHRKALEKIKGFATRTKRYAKNDIQNTKQRRIFQKFMKHYRIGEIVKLDRMLVLVKETINSNNMVFTSFTEVEPCDTRILERWKEYVVVARSTGDFESPILMQFYTKHEIPHNEKSKHADDELDFSLNKHCLVNFYSSLDKTIAIVNRGKVYVLRCQTPNSSIRWFNFLQESLGNVGSGTLKIQIPSLSISMNIKITAKSIDIVLNDEERHCLSLIYEPHGYYAKEIPALEYLVNKIKTKLSKAGYHELVDTWNKENPVLAFCWRHYDRLEWIFGETLNDLFWQQSMYLTHDLELRASQHYPSTVQTENTTLHEPSPIEGFLARLSTRSGSHRNVLFQQVFKFSYFYTTDHMLFFCRSYKALPPHPGYEHLSDPNYSVNPDNYEEIKNQVPQIYTHNPYEIDSDGHIAWLKPDISTQEFQKRDQIASYEYERRVASIVRADAVIDLLDVLTVTAANSADFPDPVRIASNIAWEGDIDLKSESEEKKNSFFELKLRNGATFALKAPNKAIRDEWVNRLTELVTYWKLRIQNDIKIIHDTKFENISKLNIDDYMEANVGEATPKWENSRGIADPLVHNISSNSMFRPVVKSGMLYQKPKKHSVFNNYFVCLVPGYIILYRVLVKSARRIPGPTTHYKHYLTISLDECYIYSGKTCGPDLLDRDSEIDKINLGRNSLPRVYKDGWISSEDEASRSFTFWFGAKRAMAGKMMMNNNEDFKGHGSRNPGIIRMVSRLGVTGRSMVFMCRSRQERDIWVSNLYTEVERFHKHTVDYFKKSEPSDS